MTVSVVLEHLLISLGGWVVGVTVGGALGTLLALGARTLFTAAPHLRRLSMLMPGRTVVLNLLIVAWTPASVILMGLRPAAALLNIALVMFLFALPFSASLLFERWYPSLFAVRIIAGLRTLATISLVATVFWGNYHGIGGYMSMSLDDLHFEGLFKGWLVLAGLILILDVLLGIVQLVVADRVRERQQLHSAT